MDEILIEEKKYVSSKQAAKVTGYAKDYIGQLCREGRVPARLVGRSWYVLESAIQDHRFGDKIEEKTQEISTSPAMPSTEWESPRYESSPVEAFPPLSRQIQDSWKEWFDRAVETKVTVAPSAVSDMPEPQEKEIEVEKNEDAEIPVAIYRKPPEELLPRRHSLSEPQNKAVSPEYPEDVEWYTKIKLKSAALVAGTLFALLTAVFAAIGSGYFDQYLISSKQESIIAGVVLYSK